MRFRTNQDARLTKAELFVHEMSAEVNQLPDFEEGSWCDIGVRQQEVPSWAQRCDSFGNKDSTQVDCTSARPVSDVRGTNRPRQRSW